MKRVLITVALLTVLVGGGVSIAIAAPDGGGFDRPAPAGSDPAKELKRAERGDTGATDLPQNLDAPEGIAGGFVFVPITPFRTLDSRDYSDGFLNFDDVVYFDVLVDQFNQPKIPADAVAVTYNLTAVNTSGGGGFLTIFPANAAEIPGTSSVNWTGSGAVVANGGTVAIGPFDAPGQVSVYLGGSPTGRADFILDITGYYI